MPSVAFDMGGVLLSDGSQTAWPALEAQFGIPAEISSQLWYSELQQPADRGEIDEHEIWEAIASLGDSVSRDSIRQVFLDGYRPIHQGVQALKEACEAGWQVIFATNNVNSWVSYWQETYAWMNLPSQIICSASIGVRKPDRDFYRVLDDLDLEEPKVFVDDKTDNLSRASEFGFSSVLARGDTRWALPDFTKDYSIKIESA